MSERRIVTRTEAVLLVIICFLVFGLAVDFSNNAGLNKLNTELQNQVDDYERIVYQEEWKPWIYNQTVSQPASSYSSWTFDAEYAGSISVLIVSSTTNETYVEVIYKRPFSYDQKTVVGSSGQVEFPVEPSSIEVRVGNSNSIDRATENVTIAYFY